MRRRARAAAAAVLAGWTLGAAGTATGQEWKTARVTYVVGASVYVDAGRQDGLAAGAALQVLRADSVTATLRVQYLASHQASCEVTAGEGSIAVGDVVRFQATALPTAQAGATVGEPGPRRRSRGAGLHGRLGARYLSASGDEGATTSQPAADVRLEGQSLGGSPLGLVADLRTRRVLATAADGSSIAQGATRVYQLALSWNPTGAPFRVQVGRQPTTRLASVSLLDGVTLEVNRDQWSIVGFGGTEPDPGLERFSRDVLDVGGYLSFHSRPASASPWAVTLGGVGSYREGHANREFGFVQLAYSGPALSIYANQEVDYYRPWKRAAGEASALSLTSTYASATLRLTRELSASGGYDSRRNVRLYRDVVDPETAFDDLYRQGAWAGLSFSNRRFRVGVDARTSFGGAGGRAEVYSGTAGLSRLGGLGVSLGGRVSAYRTDRLDGRLYTLRVGADPIPVVHLELQGGIRQEHSPQADPPDRRVAWYGADLDVAIARSWYLLLSGSRDDAPEGATTQLYGGLTFRF